MNFKNIGKYNKALVPLAMGLVYFLNTQFGFELPITETEVGIIITVATSFLTWLIPNNPNEN